MHQYQELFIHKHSKYAHVCTDTHPQPVNSYFNLSKSEALNFACEFWFSLLCLMPFKGLVKEMLQCNITQGFKIKQNVPQTRKTKERKKRKEKKGNRTKPIHELYQMKKLCINRNTEKHCVSSIISPCFFSVYSSLRSNQKWSEQYGTLKTNNSAVNRAFGRTQLCALKRERNAEATQYVSTKENPLMPI